MPLVFIQNRRTEIMRFYDPVFMILVSRLSSCILVTVNVLAYISLVSSSMVLVTFISYIYLHVSVPAHRGQKKTSQALIIILQIQNQMFSKVKNSLVHSHRAKKAVYLAFQVRLLDSI